MKFGQTNTLSEIKPHHQLVYCVQLLGTIARGNFSRNLTRTEVKLTTGIFLGFIASLAQSRIKASFFATNGNAVTVFYVLSRDVTLSNASCNLSQRRNKNAGHVTRNIGKCISAGQI